MEGKVEERGRKGVSVLEVEGTGRHRKLMTIHVYQSSNETGDYRLVFIISILLLRDILNACLQCFDAVAWAAGRASGL